MPPACHPDTSDERREGISQNTPDKSNCVTQIPKAKSTSLLADTRGMNV